MNAVMNLWEPSNAGDSFTSSGGILHSGVALDLKAKLSSFLTPTLDAS